MHHMVLLFSPPCPLNLQGIKRSRCTEGAETKSSTSVFTVLPLPSLLTQPCTLPVTESAALEEQVAAGDRANLTWLLEPEGTQFRRILKWLISANKSIKTNSHLFAITAWFCANKSNLLPNPVTKQKPGSNTPIFNHACSYYRRCMLRTAPYSIQYVYIVITSETWIINALFLPLRNTSAHWDTSI